MQVSPFPKKLSGAASCLLHNLALFPDLLRVVAKHSKHPEADAIRQ